MMMRRILPLFLLLALPAAAALVPGPEKPASAFATAATPRTEEPLAVATDGKDFLVLWNREDQALYAAKVTDTGVVATTPARRIAGGDIPSASLVWTGDAYLAMWTAGPGIMAARLDRDANAIAGPFPVTHGSVHALAWDGRRALAIANDNLGMKTLVLGAEGDLVREHRLPEIVTGDVSLVAAGNAFVVVWTVNLSNGVATVYAMTLTREGNAGTKVKLPFPTSSGVYLDAKADRDRIGIAFTQWPSPSWTPLRPLRRYTLDAFTLQFTAHPDAEATHGPAVVPTPGGFVSAVLVERGNAATLEAIPFDSTAARSTEAEPSLGKRVLTASNGRSVLALWSRGYIAGALFDTALAEKETPTFAISTSLIPQRAPELAPAGDVALHSWVEETPLGGNLVAARVDRFGNALETPRLIAGGMWAEHEAAFGRQAWIFSYRREAPDGFVHTFVRRIGQDGRALDETPLDLGYWGGSAMASNGDVTLLATLNEKGTYIQRFSAGGTRVDPELIVPGANQPATMTSNGREFLLVYSNLLAQRFDAGGNPIDVTPFPIDDSPIYRTTVHAASDGTDYYVTYARRDTIVVRRVLRGGVVANETTVGEGESPRVAVLGARPVVAFLSKPGPAPSALYVAEAGSAPLLVVEPTQFLEHALASRGNSLWLSYSRHSQEGIARVFVREIVDTPPSRRRPVRQ